MRMGAGLDIGDRHYWEGAESPVSQTEPNPDSSANAAAIVLVVVVLLVLVLIVLYISGAFRPETAVTPLSLLPGLGVMAA